MSKIKYGKLEAFSEQQLIDCTLTTTMEICDFSDYRNCFQHIESNGIARESEYPWKGQIQKCKFEEGSFQISGFKRIENSCSELISSLRMGPVAVGVDASKWAFYKSGIFNNCVIGLSWNFGAVLVAATQQYWKLKVSYGPNWG